MNYHDVCFKAQVVGQTLNDVDSFYILPSWIPSLTLIKHTHTIHVCIIFLRLP